MIKAAKCNTAFIDRFNENITSSFRMYYESLGPHAADLHLMSSKQAKVHADSFWAQLHTPFPFPTYNKSGHKADMHIQILFAASSAGHQSVMTLLSWLEAWGKRREKRTSECKIAKISSQRSRSPYLEFWILPALQVPVAVATFEKEIWKSPRAWAESSLNVKQWSIFKSGGYAVDAFSA